MSSSSSFTNTPPETSDYPNLPSTIVPCHRKPLGRDQARMDDCFRVFTQVFGHSKYKGKQKEIVDAAYGGADVLVVAPTGMGKSLCFQIPAVAEKRGVTLVVSPLLALMQNQIENLRKRNITVAALSSQVPYAEKEEIIKELQLYDSTIRLLYITPERLCATETFKLLDVVHDNHNLNRLVVDEVTVLRTIGPFDKLRKMIDRRIAFQSGDTTFEQNIDASAGFANGILTFPSWLYGHSDRDIIRSLKIVEENLFRALHPFNRVNLFYEVRYLNNPESLSQMADIFDYITTLYRRRGKASSGIVYCRMRSTCDALASYLRGKGLNARPYHRGIGATILDRTMKGWTAGPSDEGGGVDLVVATIAFGLGIDKSDVRYIIHYDMPKSFEGYYQETGRAGRDGHPSKCILYYSREDVIRVKRFVHSPHPNRVREDDHDGPTPTQQATGSLDALINFAESTTLCRHVSICRYFGEPIDEKDLKIVKLYCNQMCDICKYPEKTRARASKLSSMDDALMNVPPPRPANNSIQGQPKMDGNDWQGRQLGNQELGAQKRAGSGLSENSSKKPKVTYAPIMVTRPYASASGLSKPFRPPSFVGAAPKPALPTPSAFPTVPKHPIPRSIKPIVVEDIAEEVEDVEMGHRESSPVDLPDVDMIWRPDHSTKVPEKNREDKFDVLRRSLYKVCMSTSIQGAVWSKLSTLDFDTDKKNEIIFQAANDLELSAISLSSTSEGYNERILTMKEDIRSIASLNLWDIDDADFEDSQDIIQSLRRYCVSPPKKRTRHAR
ncbi:P-loop containing nucleoside triphosphate hydrolase protein [Crassisporium funariophilum]|nr:P-loop containing nucleoside triphosphate hydrolase protein [Crassisporium funariophilum]